MHKKTTILLLTEFFIVSLSLFTTMAVRADNDRYIWPIEIVGDISGNFGECRSDHFHAGLDIATNQKTGYKLYSIASGSVYRVKTSAGGYGKALYLKLNDGRYVVYAHCERFIQPIDQYVRQLQKKAGTYEIDYYVPENLFTFKQGDIVAYSGQSGDVAPHLHIELRNENEDPINILSHGLSLAEPDTSIPVLFHLAIKPTTYSSFVDNNLNQNLYPLTQVNESTYLIKRPISVWGKLGLKLSSIDYDNTGRYKLAPYVTSLQIDGKTVYTVKLDRVSYKQDYHDTFYLYDRELRYMVSSNVSGDYMRLFTLPGANLINCSKSPTDGYLRCGDTTFAGHDNFLSTGDHNVAIHVADLAGNTATLKCTLRVEYPAIISQAMDAPSAISPIPLQVNPQILMYDDFFSILLTTNRQPDQLPDVTIENRILTLDPKQVLIRSNNTIEYVFVPEKAFSGISVMNIKYNETAGKEQIIKRTFPLSYIPAQSTPSSVQFKVVDLRFQSTHRAIMPFIEPIQDTPEKKRVSLKKISATYRIRPNGFQLRNPATIQFKITEKIPGIAALFEWIDNRWRLLYPIDTPENDIVAAKINHLSTYAVFADSQPPVLTFVSPQQKNTTMVPGETIVCKAEDDGVGVAYKYISMTISDIKVPAEYNFDSSSISYTIDDTLPTGSNEIVINARDRLGNTTSIKTTINIE